MSAAYKVAEGVPPHALEEREQAALRWFNHGDAGAAVPPSTGDTTSPHLFKVRGEVKFTEPDGGYKIRSGGRWAKDVVEVLRRRASASGGDTSAAQQLNNIMTARAISAVDVRWGWRTSRHNTLILFARARVRTPTASLAS